MILVYLMLTLSQGFYYTLARVTTVIKIDMDGKPEPKL
jgi:hypothetical protein